MFLKLRHAKTGAVVMLDPNTGETVTELPAYRNRPVCLVQIGENAVPVAGVAEDIASRIAKARELGIGETEEN